MATQQQAADLYTTLQERAANDQAQLTAERVRLAEMRATRETRRELEAAQAQADEDALHAMGAVAIAIWCLMFLSGIALFAGGMYLMGITHNFWLGAISIPGGVMVLWCLRAAVSMGSAK